MSNQFSEDQGSAKSIWAIVPAAGIGRRMQCAIPKQYLQLCGKPVLQLTLERLLSVPQVEGVVVALQHDDAYWNTIKLVTGKTVLRAEGGDERCHSVVNALHRLSQHESFDDTRSWVLVHDAVRPCVSVAEIERLITEVSTSQSGGLLATPVRDTMKRQADDQTVASTVDRRGLWHALTPQLFPFKVLLEALLQAEKQGFIVTDDAAAMEQAGYAPKLVPGSDKNIKITRPEDLDLAEKYYLEEAEKECE